MSTQSPNHGYVAGRGLLPTLETPRLILRPFRLADAPDVQRLAGERAIAETTATIPHPYPDGLAEEWISNLTDQFARGENLTLAVTRRADGALLGAISLEINAAMQRAELGYWIGKPFWNHGYGSEAARALVRHAFDVLHLRRVFAQQFGRNPASGKVLQKAGLRHEGVLRGHIVKWGTADDIHVYGALRDEWLDSG